MAFLLCGVDTLGFPSLFVFVDTLRFFSLLGSAFVFFIADWSLFLLGLTGIGVPLEIARLLDCRHNNDSLNC
jgi:hypothetical protein